MVRLAVPMVAGLLLGSNLSEIRCRELHQGRRKASHELQLRSVPPEMFKENASDGLYVVHSERD